MFTGLSQMVEEINQDIRDTNKERNLRSVDPAFCDRFKKEWDATTAQLRDAYKQSREGSNVVRKNSYVRYSASAIEFR